VFPVGMYAACSFDVRDAVSVGGVGDFARVWVWLAVSLWLVLLAGIARRGLALARAAPMNLPPRARLPDERPAEQTPPPANDERGGRHGRSDRALRDSGGRHRQGA